MTFGTRDSIELARRITGGTRGELGRDRGEDSMTIVNFALAICELSRPNKIDQARVDDGDYDRACGDAECSRCGKPYYDHPTVVGFEWLHRTCDGRFVKL
jgi:hypothetical protein